VRPGNTTGAVCPRTLVAGFAFSQQRVHPGKDAWAVISGLWVATLGTENWLKDQGLLRLILTETNLEFREK
jgi:hypothetical protein